MSLIIEALYRRLLKVRAKEVSEWNHNPINIRTHWVSRIHGESRIGQAA